MIGADPDGYWNVVYNTCNEMNESKVHGYTARQSFCQIG